MLLAIGCRLIREYRYLSEPVIKPETRCIHIEEDPWEIGKIFPVDVGIIADARSALGSLLDVYPRIASDTNGKRNERLDCIKKAKEQVNTELETRVKQGWDATPINTARLARTMDRLIEKDALIVNESPTSKDILMANFQFSKSRSYFSNSSGGYLGWGLGAAIGAKLASRNRRVVACLGDGSTMFGLQGLWTLAKYRVPLTVIVFNNRAYMAVKNQFRGSEERVRIAAEMGAELVGPDLNFARLADTFGIFGQRVEQPDAIEPALKRALEQNGPGARRRRDRQNTRKINTPQGLRRKFDSMANLVCPCENRSMIVRRQHDSEKMLSKNSLGAENKAYNIIAKLDPEYFEKLKGLYVDGTFGREGALPRQTKELIMVGICCALNRPRGVRLHSERALTLGASPREVLEAVEVAAIPGGMPGLWLGVETLEEVLKAKGIEFK